MVRRIILALDDEEFSRLKDLKQEKTWKQFLVDPILEKEAGKP